MRVGRNKQGYTIVETMIFLAVSGVMFVIAAAFVSGKQAKSEFRQGMNDINTQLQQVINDVGNGFYPPNKNFTCTSSSGDLHIASGGSGNEQGTNIGCVFLGKVVQFAADNNPINYYVYSVAGSQYANAASSGSVPANFSQATPRAVDSITDKKTLQWGLQVTGMYDNDGTPISAIGFFGSFGSDLTSGSQLTNVVVMKPTAAVTASTGNEEATMVGKIQSDTVDANLRSTPNVLICFKNQANQYGSVTIGGGNGQRLTTAVKISSSMIAGCPA